MSEYRGTLGNQLYFSEPERVAFRLVNYSRFNSINFGQHPDSFLLTWQPPPPPVFSMTNGSSWLQHGVSLSVVPLRRSISGDAFREVITHTQVHWKPRLCVYVGEITPPQELSCGCLQLAGFSPLSNDIFSPLV